MNYQNIYTSIVERAKQRPVTGYVERHHILPRCMGGKDASDNLVDLTPEEHFLCHQLLARIHRDTEHYHKLIFAVQCMTRMGPNRKGFSKLKTFGWIKREVANALSAINKGKPKSQAMRDKLSSRVISDETKAKISQSLKGRTKVVSDETKAKVSATLTGRKMSPETKAKIAAAMRGKNQIRKS